MRTRVVVAAVAGAVALGAAAFAMPMLDQGPSTSANPAMTASAYQHSEWSGSRHHRWPGHTHTATPSPTATTTVPTATTSSATTTASTKTSTTTSSAPSSTTSSTTAGAGATGCLAKPSSCGYPDATNTGVPAGTALKPSGDVTIGTAGAVVSGLNVTGCVTITASNVTFKDSIVHGTSCRANVHVVQGVTGVKVDHVEIDGKNAPSTPGLYGWGFTATAMNIHTTGDAVDIEQGSSLQDSYLHDLVYNSGDHTDGVQATEGNNMVIKHNTILANGTNMNEGIIIGADLGNIDNVVVENNIIDGNNNDVVAGSNPGYNATNLNVLNNRFGKDAQFGPCNFNKPVTFTGNVWDANGASLSC